jgi:hypothetical protein
MDHPPVIIDIDRMKSLKDKILSLNFRKSNVLGRFGVQNYISWEKENDEMPSKIWKYLSGAPADDLDIIIRLLVFNQEIDKKLSEKILSSEGINALLESGIVENSNDDMHYFSKYSMFEYDGLLFITDSIINEPSNFNPVMPLLPESYELVEIQIKKQVSKTLDLGTGSGVQAIIASRHSENVTGVDINPRAIAFSKFNAALNGIKNTEFYVSDLFNAVNGQTFDLILSNPPYMPDKNFNPGDNFFCGGLMGDAIWSKIIRKMDNYLNYNGICQIIHMIIDDKDESYQQKVSYLLGEQVNKYSVLVLSKPIDFKNENIPAFYSTKFAISNFKKYKNSKQFSFSEVPFPHNFANNNFIDKF